MSAPAKERFPVECVVCGAIACTAEVRCADDGDGYEDVWLTNPEAIAEAVLAEIERTHVLVPRGLARRLAVAAAASDCFEENGAPCIRGDDWAKIDALKGV